MYLRDGQLSISPTDLSYFLSCKHRTGLELSVAHGVRTRPVWDDPLLEALFAMGLAHEREYVERLQQTSGSVVDLSDLKDRDTALARTQSAMRDGTEVIVQAALARGRWYGRPDVLLKVDRPSPALGAWSYEPADTKLARETRGGTILQLGLYCEMLEEAQGIAPAEFYVVTPGTEERGAPAQSVHTFRFHDYAAYFRLLKAGLERAVAMPHEELAAANYPEPVDHCEVCPWIVMCRERRRDDDHLSLVAGISRLQRRELEGRGIRTMEALAGIGNPLPFTPRRGAAETYERVRDQARVQVRSRNEEHVAYELIPLPASSGTARSEGFGGGVLPEPVGLARLPEPSPGDIFLDLEGDPLASDGGREYLFGLVVGDSAGGVEYRRWWAVDGPSERRVFEEVVDLIVRRREEHPDMHVYHYAPYEPSAMKRLMGRYATREREVDELLRGRRFVDLYAVVRQGVRAGVERYSIKNLEPLYGFERSVELRDANRALRIMEQALELDRLDLATPDVRNVVEGYNHDDCVSTLRLRDWLEARRAEVVERGTPIERPPLVLGEPSQELDDKAKAVEALRARLLALGTEHEARSSAEHEAPGTEKHEARSTEHGAHAEASPEFTLAYLLDFHRRDDKAGWWEYYRLCELPEEDLLEERAAVAGLEFVEEVEQIKRSVVHRYRYPEQEVEIRPGQELKVHNTRKKFCTVVEIDRGARLIDLLVSPANRAARPTALFAHKHIGSDVIEGALFALGERAADAGGVAALPPCPARALLLREPPRLASADFEPPPHEAGQAVTDYAVGIVTGLDRTVLPIQGPPGSGKTYTGARMVCELVRAGRKVGVTATSHKVIVNLLEAVAKEAAKQKLAVRLGRKPGKDDELDETDGESTASPDAIRTFSDNDAPLAALQAGEVHVLGGTAWLWAREEYAGSVDVLFVDEAGQMSLANTLGVAHAAGSLVLLGDPQQLDQPSKGTHPEGVGVSALQHILAGEQTMPEGKGLFLPITWRLPPSICAFTSELFYAGQLESKPGLERQVLAGNGQFEGSGLWLVEVEHDGNRNGSDEETAEVARIVDTLLAPGSTWIDEHGGSHDLQPDDIRIVAPFNAHVARIREALSSRPGVPVGTVDKFQGQEAPVVIYSMATSRPEDAPRGMEFLFSLNRLNVATSRARCAAIVVLSPRLLEPECRTPRQMRLANALCRYREMARVECANRSS